MSERVREICWTALPKLSGHSNFDYEEGRNNRSQVASGNTAHWRTPPVNLT